MANRQQIQFAQRVRRIERERRRLARGYVTRLNSDGLLINKPRSPVRFPVVPVVFLCLATILALKVLVMLRIGEQDYNARVAHLLNGSRMEQLGAYVMYADPVTVTVARMVASRTG